ncbi:MliC family protein [Salinisphaera sp. LB1]|uniref:MliC family protein n=1 Tax=Salinisphaera sp. LB1 TaxID=2183911 RepID=UPI000D70507D|nr:MliC family protein [Salinisphaera sp. LB1]AWN17289.1 Periplasmic lysozyme inhibitor of c-type lysozyme [Salinisphaera sp. LB1]
MLRRCFAPALAGAIALIALAGCAPDTLPRPEGSAASATPTTGGPVGGKPARHDAQTTNHAAQNSAIDYDCNNGSTISARYPDTNHAVVRYQGHKLPMHIAISADGARYVGKHYEWWTRGTGRGAKATLFAHGDNGSTGNAITVCHQQ